MTALVGIVCDGNCGRRIDTLTYTQVTTTMVRDQAKRNGWHKTRGVLEGANGETWGYAKDICPSCWQKGKR